ncbi:zinc finger CCHC domain-containing protein 8 homolog isoform X1 [Drosophila virilis]|uniref:zinc finger CCHC domain-containing protein 8 homolog isoform X1 n=1 Tax=Drosophila virilis TaxID=7244 RepID=UPI0013965207|nr:zinc finger CCHC domain-containing protein 8 homolog isoform X1 [Drosophila virilis]
MDNSVIEINDSIITIDSDADVEDGEVREVEENAVNIAAKEQPPPSPGVEGTNDQQKSITPEGLIFEVNFTQKDDFERLQERLVKALSATFAGEEFVYTTKDTSISVHRRAISPEPECDIFQIDTSPATKLNAAQVPSYKRCHTEVLDEGTLARKKLKLEAVNKCFRPKVQSACFNCGGVEHSLRECTRPRNQARIQRARKKNSRAERYHVDTEQRFAHIRPGRISSKTRHAMGYSRGELPFMFYRMRVLGYPPAWLEEAKVQSSGIALFNADGSEVQGPEEEMGETDSFKYDVNKIIDFPGFNAQPGSKFYDDFQHHNVPPFQEHQLKENFIKSLGENVTKAYKRKKLVDLPTPHDASPTLLESDTNLVEHDMELDDDETEGLAMQPPLPAEPSKATTPPPPPAQDTSIRSPSPTLEDLKAQQDQLLEQLESNTSFNTSEVELPHVPQTEEKETAAPATPVESSQPNIFKAPSIAGTPILKFSVYDKLPVGDNFKVGVSDVINFENLPDSTGKYEQMKDLLKNVRQKMEKLQNEDN